jgi:hypothetical protein
MPQISQPINPDLSNAHWTPSPIYPQVNEVDANDSTFVTSSGSNSGDSFEVSMADILAPSIELPVVAGPWTLQVRLEDATTAGSGSGSKSGSGYCSSADVWVNIQLRQKLLTGGETQTIAQTYVPATNLFVTNTLVLTQANIDLIEYDDNGHAGGLSVLVTTLPPVSPSSSCCACQMPAVLTATFVNGAGGCQCLNGVSFKLIWAGNNTYTGVLQPNCGGAGGQPTVTFSCVSGRWQIAMDSCIVGVNLPNSSSCSPVYFPFLQLSGGPVGGGGVNCCPGGTVALYITG